MRHQILNRIYMLVALAAFGCAGAQVTQQSSSAPISAGPPTAVVVYPFAVDAADVSSVRQQTLQTVSTSNFRNDLNASGRIDAADVSIARQDTLHSLPSTP